MNNSDARTRLLTHIAAGNAWIELCARYGLPPDTPVTELDETIRMAGFLGFVFDTVPGVLDAAILLGDQAKAVRKKVV